MPGVAAGGALWASVTVSSGQTSGQSSPDSRALPIANGHDGPVPGVLMFSPSLLPPVAMFESDKRTQKVEVVSSHDEDVSFTASTHVTGLFGGWVEVEPAELAIPAQGVAELSVTFTTEGLWQGRYHGSIVLDSPSMPQEVSLDVQLLNFCSELRASTDLPLAVTFLEDDTLTVTESVPLWDASFSGDSAVWVELPFQFSRPVDSVPALAFRASSDVDMTILEVTRRDIRGAMCSDFVARIRAPTDPWRSSSTSLCVTLQAGAVSPITDPGEAFPEMEHCLVVHHQPHGRLLGVFMAQSGDAGLVTSNQLATILVMFSAPLDEVSFSKEDFFIEGPLEPSIPSLQKVDSNGKQWHLVLDLGEYYGEVRVGLRGDVEDLHGNALAPVPVLGFQREKVTPLETLGYRVHKVTDSEL
eukprot:CAMPEP_0117667282 /NCGR_PEP_ID=MMETSP0804-20121206/10868_1 /TAXON_ID=1074897 /ORGANISM="Tetraselmis astigmatica, Strain CCMP880" /LENGTH=413 /DNA_ID=CAMNT_0005474967 /DNA_START=413 /DNA_END=1655 /DNA_ORIENTATION=+